MNQSGAAIVPLGLFTERLIAPLDPGHSSNDSGERVDPSLLNAAPSSPPLWQILSTPLLPPSSQTPLNLVARPFELLKEFSSRYRPARIARLDALIAAEDHFDRIMITVRSNPDLQSWQHLSLSSIPDLSGIDPRSTIFGFGRESSLSPNPRFLAAITVPLSDLGNDTSEQSRSPMAGVETRCYEPRKKFPIPSDRMLLALLRYNSDEKRYELIKPNRIPEYNVADYLCSVSSEQLWISDKWPWRNLVNSLSESLAVKGLDVDAPYSNLSYLNDIITIKAQDSEKLPQPYEVLADVLDGIARVNCRRKGLLQSGWTRPERPRATNITGAAEGFARETGVAAIREQLGALVEEGRYLLGQEIDPTTVGCLGELISRLEKEAKSASRRSDSALEGNKLKLFQEKSVQLSRLRSDLDNIIGFWRPSPGNAPECVKDVFRAIDDLRPGIITEDKAVWCQNLLKELELGLQGVMRGY